MCLSRAPTTMKAVLAFLAVSTLVQNAITEITNEDLDSIGKSLRKDVMEAALPGYASAIRFLHRHLKHFDKLDKEEFVIKVLDAVENDNPPLIQRIREYATVHGIDLDNSPISKEEKQSLAALNQCILRGPRPADPGKEIKKYLAESKTSFKTDIAPYRVYKGLIEAALFKYMANFDYCFYKGIQALMCPITYAQQSTKAREVGRLFRLTLPPAILSRKNQVYDEMMPAMVQSKLDKVDPRSVLTTYDRDFQRIKDATYEKDDYEEYVPRWLPEGELRLWKTFSDCFNKAVATTDQKYFPIPENSCAGKYNLHLYGDRVGRLRLMETVFSCRWVVDALIPDNFDREVPETEFVRWENSINYLDLEAQDYPVPEKISVEKVRSENLDEMENFDKLKKSDKLKKIDKPENSDRSGDLDKPENSEEKVTRGKAEGKSGEGDSEEENLDEDISDEEDIAGGGSDEGGSREQRTNEPRKHSWMRAKLEGKSKGIHPILRKQHPVTVPLSEFVTKVKAFVRRLSTIFQRSE